MTPDVQTDRQISGVAGHTGYLPVCPLLFI